MEISMSKKKHHVNSEHRSLCLFLLAVLLVLTVHSPARAEGTNVPVKLNPERYLRLPEQECVNRLRKLGLDWSENKEYTKKGIRELTVSSSGFSVLCMQRRVVEINLYRPDAKKKGFQGAMPKALVWGDTLTTIKKKMGKPQHEEDVADHNTYYVGYESKGRRMILSLTREASRKLKGIRIQALPISPGQSSQP